MKISKLIVESWILLALSCLSGRSLKSGGSDCQAQWSHSQPVHSAARKGMSSQLCSNTSVARRNHVAGGIADIERMDQPLVVSHEPNKNPNKLRWVWKKWWWHKKSICVQKKFIRDRSTIGSTMICLGCDAREGGAPQKRNEEVVLPRQLHIEWNDKLFRFQKVRADGWCLHNSLATAESDNKSGGQVRQLLAKATSKRTCRNNQVFTLFEKIRAEGSEPWDENSVVEDIERYNLKVKSRERGFNWGGE